MNKINKPNTKLKRKPNDRSAHLANDQIVKRQLATAAKKIVLLLPQSSVPNTVIRFFLKSTTWAAREGHHGLKRWKSLMLWITRVVLGVTVSNPRAPARVPRAVRAFIRKACNGERERLVALSLCQLHRLIILKPEYDTSTITDGFKGSLTSLMLNVKALKKAAGAFSDRGISSPIPECDLKWVFSGASGPNGPVAWKRFAQDFQAVHSSSLKYFIYFLYKALPIANGSEVEKMWESASSYFLKERKWKHFSLFQNVENVENHIHSRLAFLSDKGGKTRVVAIGDVLSQSLLKPVHSHMFRILRKLDTDGTFDQDRQRRRVREATSGSLPVYSLDMSNCTDRLPVWFQACCLYWTGTLTMGQTIAWLLVCTKRDFRVSRPGKTSFVRYAVGQPMGLLSSWSVMAFSHHVLVAWAAERVGLGNFRNYAILGDDIVIWDQAVATSYKELLSFLGVGVADNKSYAQVGVAEFAKSFFYFGKDFKPISPSLLLWSNLEGPAKCVALGENFREKSLGDLSYWFQAAFPRSRCQRLATLLVLRGCGFVWGVEWRPTPIHEMFLLTSRFNRHYERAYRKLGSLYLDAFKDWAADNMKGFFMTPNIVAQRSYSDHWWLPPERDLTGHSWEVVCGPNWVCFDPVWWSGEVDNPLHHLTREIALLESSVQDIKRKRNPPFTLGKEYQALIKLGDPLWWPYWNASPTRRKAFQLWHC